MPRAVSFVLRLAFSLLSRRFVQVILWFFVALYGVDRFVFAFTQKQWFASLGYESLWLARAWAQITLFGYFLLVCLLLTKLFLGSVTKFPHDDATRLRGALVRFEPLRHGSPRLGWWLAWICALVLAKHFSSHWSQWLFLQSTSRSDFIAYGGLPATLWTHVLPILAPFLWALWDFSLVLLVIVTATGTLRALPLLAAREPTAPPLLPRVLWGLVAWLLGVRTVLYGVQILSLNRGRPLETGDVFISFPLFAIGALACLVLTFSSWWRARRVRVPQKWPRLASGVAAALFLPGVLNFLTTPLRSALPETDWLRRERVRATRAAWNLTFAQHIAVSSETPASTAAPWPVWDEASLLKALSAVSFRNGRVPVWQSATLDFENGKWSAVVAGTAAQSEAWNASRDAGKSNQLAFERITFGTPNGTLARQPLQSHAYFGFEGNSLFTDDAFGVPVGSFWSKWLWAWRLRDLFLPGDSGDDSHLLTLRGASERAAVLVPFWKVSGTPELYFNGGTPFWVLDLCAVTADFPGAMVATAGDLAGANAASDSVKMLMDARTGAVTFYAAPQSKTPQFNSFLLDGWRGLLPSTLKSTALMPDEMQLKWRASPAWLRAQLDLEEVLQPKNVGVRSVYGPTLGLNAAGKVVWRLLAQEKKGWKTLEAPRGTPTAPLLNHGEGDFASRLAALDVAVGKISPANSVERGDPVAWSDPQAPGGWWIGRAFFARTRQAQRAGVVLGGGPTLWRVALTGSIDSKVEVNPSARDLVPLYLGQSLPGGESSAPGVPLEVQALQAYDAAQKAVKSGGSDWVTFGRESARLKALLLKMVARTPAPTVTPTAVPAAAPTATPTTVPTALPTTTPTAVPTLAPTPTAMPTITPKATPKITPKPTPTP